MIIQRSLSSIADINPKWIDRSQRGKWFHWNRIYLVKSESGIHVVSMNLFQRLAKALSKLGNADYFAKVVKSKTIKILNPASFKHYKKPSPTAVAKPFNPPAMKDEQATPAKPASLPTPPIRDPNATP